MIFSFTMLIIGFGSLGGGAYNNYNISLSFLYFFIFIIYHYRIEVFKYFNMKILISILLMLGLFFISCLFPTFENYTDIWERYYAIASCFIFSYLSYILLRKKDIDFYLIFKLLAIIGFFHVLFLLFMWLYLQDPKNYNWTSGLYFFSNIRHLIDFLTICFLCALTLFIHYPSKLFIKWGGAAIAAVILGCVIWSGSRAAYVGLIPSLILLVWQTRKNYWNLIGLFFIFLFSLYFPTLFDTSSKDLGFSQAIHRSTQGSVEQASTGRLDLYKHVFEWFSYHPIWGNGAEAMTQMEIYIGNLSIFQAHNSILQVLVEFGVAGLFGVLYVFYILLMEFKGRQLNEKQFFSLVIIINILTAALFNGGAYYVVTISLMGLFVAIIFAEEKIKDE